MCHDLITATFPKKHLFAPHDMKSGDRQCGAGALASGSHQEPKFLIASCSTTLTSKLSSSCHKKAALPPSIAIIFQAGRTGKM